MTEMIQMASLFLLQGILSTRVFCISARLSPYTGKNVWWVV